MRGSRELGVKIRSLKNFKGLARLGDVPEGPVGLEGLKGPGL